MGRVRALLWLCVRIAGVEDRQLGALGPRAVVFNVSLRMPLGSACGQFRQLSGPTTQSSWAGLLGLEKRLCWERMYTGRVAVPGD
jgi:hypothetical protein